MKMIKLSFYDNDNDFKIAHLSDFFFSRTITINFWPINARIQVIVSLSLCSVTWALCFLHKFFLVHHLSLITNLFSLFLNCVHGIRVNNQHENEGIGSKVDIKVEVKSVLRIGSAHNNVNITPRENVCACVNITEICIANVMSRMSSVPNVVKNSKWKPLRCFAFSMKMQAE
jgi:hypothetical protein